MWITNDYNAYSGWNWLQHTEYNHNATKTNMIVILKCFKSTMQHIFQLNGNQNIYLTVEKVL